MPFIHNEEEGAFEPSYASWMRVPLLDGCECCMFEAWERMTYGGVTARYGKSPSYPVIIAGIGGHLKWVSLAVRG